MKNELRRRACAAGIDDSLQRLAVGAARRPMVLPRVNTPHARRRRDRFGRCEICGNPCRSNRCAKCAANH